MSAPSQTTSDLTLLPNEKRVLYLLALVQFTHIADFMIMMPLGPQFMALFDIDPVHFGWLVSSYTLCAAAAGIGGSLFIDRWERKRLLCVLYLCFCAATLLCALANHFWIMLFARGLAGAFGGLLGSLVQTMALEHVPPARRGQAMGLLMLAFSASTIFGVPMGLYLAAYFNWRAPFLFLGLLSVLVLLVALRYLPRRQPTPPNFPHWWSPWVYVLRVPRHWLAFLFVILLMLSGFSVIPYISVYLVNNLGLTAHDQPLLYLAGGAATFMTARLIGRLADQYGKLRVYRVMAVLACGPLLAMTHLPVVPLWVMVVVCTAFFVFVSGRMIPGMALVGMAAQPDIRGSFMSLQSSVLQLGSGLAALAGGALLAHGEHEELIHYNRVGYLAVSATAAAILLSGYLWRQIQRMPGGEKND
ncbi:MFS transporter [Parvibium lacunae]|uniref:MFS transporter n=1 Tax=Parvibium lacunae TaxID=1888893 RepID=A0A368KZR5_9BURK|nr:MFS transporter [Parvibium lacunae]RCS56795.1 MFS transporter [Parvibium lacunae]